MRRHLVLMILGLSLLPSPASAQTAKAPAVKPAAKAAPTTPEVIKKLYDLGYPAIGESVELGVSQWRSRTGRKTIGPLTAEEIAAVQQEPLPATFGAYLGDPFRGYGVAVKQASRAEAAALALDACSKNGGPSCQPGRQIVFTGKRCIALAGYKDQVGADGKVYSAFSPSVGDSAELASATAVRNCATDADGQTHCKALFVHCADGSSPQPASPAAAPAQTSTAPAPQPPQTPAPQTPAKPALSMADIANKLFALGFPVSGKPADDAMTAIAQWRFRATGKPTRDPLTPAEIEAIMSTPRPTVYGAFAGTTFSGFGLASQSVTREQAEAEAVTRCGQAKGTECDTPPPIVVTGTRCIAFAGYTGAEKADGQKHTLSASGMADDPASATQSAMSRCGQEPDNAPLCQPLIAVCADGRQATPVVMQSPAPAVSAPITPAPGPVVPQAAPQPAPSRPSAEVMNKLFDLGFPVTGKAYDDPAIAIGQWRGQILQSQTPQNQAGALSAEETAAILAAPAPTTYAAFAGDPFGVHGFALQRYTRAKAEVDAVATCRQKRGNCDADAYVVADGRCLAFAGLVDETGTKPRSQFFIALGTDAAAANARAVTRCGQKPADAPLCKLLLTVCGDGR